MDKLLSKSHAEERASHISMEKRGADPEIFGSPISSSNTVSFNVIDGEGNSVSAVNSNYMYVNWMMILVSRRGYPFERGGGDVSCRVAKKDPAECYRTTNYARHLMIYRTRTQGLRDVPGAEGNRLHAPESWA